MPTTVSPLRYPGGKTALYPFMHNLLTLNHCERTTYIEPFAGGAGLALKLLFSGDVENIIINDIDPAIYTFWYSVLRRTDDFCTLIEMTPVTIKSWYEQKEIFEQHGDGDLLQYGFSAFFLNRTNVSGILKGGVIGGQGQTGKYKIDARFHKEALIQKIRRIANERERIFVYNLDAIDLILSIIPHYKSRFINFDPPYVQKGAQLYTNAYHEQDHRMLAKLIRQLQDGWMVTYDNCRLIREIYEGETRCLIPISYSAGATKRIEEIGVFSRDIKLPHGITYLDFERCEG